jgi:hypothetical protein
MGLLDAFKNTNIFGARRPTYLEGIATPEQLKQAEQQSLVQGLLGTAVGYLAQPKNQGYGSAIPYLAKGYLQGMQSAQAPYQGLERDVLMKSKFQDIQREQDIAKQQRQMTEQLLNDPRVQGNPLYESMAVNAPADLFKELEKVTVIREGGKAIKGSTGEVIAESPKAPKAPEDKRSEFQRIVDTYESLPEDDPKKPLYRKWIESKTQDKSTQSKPTAPKAITKTSVDTVKDVLDAKGYNTISGNSELKKYVASKANLIMSQQKGQIDEATAMSTVIDDLVKKGVISIKENKLFPDIGDTNYQVDTKKLYEPSASDEWQIEKIS